MNLVSGLIKRYFAIVSPDELESYGDTVEKEIKQAIILASV
jgi:hypothetical protein